MSYGRRVADTTPARLALPSDHALVGRVGVPTFERGRAYWRSGAVSDLSTGGRGDLLLAAVRGSGHTTYRTLVTRDAGSWTSRCSCPVQVDCKHVVALLLAARQASQPHGPSTEARPAWEERLAALAEPVVSPPGDVLALHLESVVRKASRWSAAPGRGGRRLRLRPMAWGKSGQWVRTGVGWRDLEYGYGPRHFDPAHREAVLAVLAAVRGRSPAHRWSVDDVHLDEVGAPVWGLLASAVDAGIALVTGAGGQQAVELAAGASVAVDARRSVGGDLRLTPVLRLPDHPDRPLHTADGAVLLIGEPPHGVAIEGPTLVLARLDPPLDADLTRLLGEQVEVPARDVGRFVDLYLPTLRRRLTVQSGDDSLPLPEVVPPRLALDLVVEPDHVLHLRWRFAYGTADPPTYVPVVRSAGTSARDDAAEQALLDRLAVLDAVPGLRVPLGPHGQPTLVPEQRLRGWDTVTFVERLLPLLQADEQIEVRIEGDLADYGEIVDAPLIRVSATDSADEARADWFDLAVTVSVGGHQVPFSPLFSALTRGDGRLLLVDGSWFRLDRPELESLRALIEEARALQERDVESLRISPLQSGLWDDLVALGVVDQQSSRWVERVRALQSLADAPTPEPPSGLRATLRPYQVAGYTWLSALWDNGLGGILADDMGLGKTLQTLAVVLRALERGDLDAGPVLVVAPTSVVGTWADEAARTCPDLRVVTVSETERKRRIPLRDTVQGAHVVVTSYALVRLDDVAYREQPWSGLVLDEAQFVKNHRAKTYAAVRRVEAPFRLAITGTPLENSLMDLWALLSLSAAGLFPDPERFAEHYRRPIESGKEPDRLAALRARIRPFMLRRTKDEVAPDLPPKVEQPLFVALNPQHRRIYQTHLQRERARVLGLLDDMSRNRVAVFRSLTRLRQLALDVSLVDDVPAGVVRSSKIDALIEQLTEVVAEGHRALVFSQFTGFLSLVRERLDAEGIGHVYLDGRTRDRAARITAFREGDDPVFCISLKAGGFGLTLTEANYVFVLDPWWNPAAEEQAIDRTHRIGQHRSVNVYRLIAAGTIEEKVVALQQRKRDLFAQVVDGGAGASGAITADDVRALLAVDPEPGP